MSAKTYREAMDAEHVPQEKADETLRLMLEKDRAIRQKAARKRAASPWLRRLPVLTAAAAVCLVAVWIGLRPAPPSARFTNIQISSLPAVSPLGPGGSALSPDLSDPDAVLTDARALFSGCDIVDPVLDGRTACFTVKKSSSALSAAVTDVEPPLASYLIAHAEPDEAGVYYAADTDTAARYAVCRKGRLYVVLSSDTADASAFSRAVRDALGP